MKAFNYLKNKFRKKPKISESGGWIGFNEHYLDEKLLNSIASFINSKNIKTCNDLGAGCQARYSLKLNEFGTSVNAYDYNPEILKIKDISTFVIDLTEKQEILKSDLVLCLEVGEHISDIYFNNLLHNITSASKNYIILSWAIIGQDGHGHVNCKSNFEIIYQFNKLGFKLSLEDTNLLRNNVSLPWFKHSLFVFEKNSASISN